MDPTTISEDTMPPIYSNPANPQQVWDSCREHVLHELRSAVSTYRSVIDLKYERGLAAYIDLMALHILQGRMRTQEDVDAACKALQANFDWRQRTGR